MIEFLKLGWHTTIQDLGRFGHQSLGVPVSGAMDLKSFHWANKLLNNIPNAACFEMTTKGPELKFHQETYIALTGALMPALLNSSPIKMYVPVKIKTGDILSFSSVTKGCRTYMSILGGFQTETILESKSQYKGITLKDRILKKTLIGYDKLTFSPKRAKIKVPEIDFNDLNLKVYEGPEFNLLNSDSQNQLKNKYFTISQYNNRMGYRLDEKISQQLPQIWTGPTLPGTVQLTPNGTLIVLMRDAQVTGGYPRILQLSEDAIDLLAQKTTKELVKFENIATQ